MGDCALAGIYKQTKEKIPMCCCKSCCCNKEPEREWVSMQLECGCTVRMTTDGNATGQSFCEFHRFYDFKGRRRVGGSV